MFANSIICSLVSETATIVCTRGIDHEPNREFPSIRSSDEVDFSQIPALLLPVMWLNFLGTNKSTYIASSASTRDHLIKPTEWITATLRLIMYSGHAYTPNCTGGRGTCRRSRAAGKDTDSWTTRA